MDDRWFRLGDRGRYPDSRNMRFSLKFMMLAVLAFCICFPFAYRHFAVYRASSGMLGVGRAKLTDYQGFRVCVLYDVTDGHGEAKIIAIEQNSEEPTFATLDPSFARIDMSQNRATMYINGSPILPTSELVAYFAHEGQSPSRVVLDRARYREISQDGIMPSYNDRQLWNLCLEAENEN